MPYMPDAAKRSARMMMQDAAESVLREHTGLTKHYLSNKAKTFLAKWSTESKVSIGTGVAVAVSVTIAGAVTGGIAIPVLIALAASTYALKNAIELIGGDYRRANRNWLQRFPSAKPKEEAEMGVFLTVEASDSLRRAVDHFRMMKTIGQEMKDAAKPDFVSCEDAINYAKAVSRFIHHGDKVRNYTLPVLDLLIFYLDQYAKISERWTEVDSRITESLQRWFEQHGNARCCAGGDKDVCYATSFADPLALPFKRHAEATEPLTECAGAMGPAPELPGAVKVSEVLERMRAAREKIVASMHATANASWNYSAERPVVMTRVRAGGAVADVMHRRRLETLLDAVWRQVDRPGYFVRAARRAEHWYTRTTRSEKIGAVISELLALGTIFVPFVGEANELTKLGQSAVSSSITSGVLVGDKVGINLLKGVDGPAVRSRLLDHVRVSASVTRQIGTEEGAGVEKLMSKLMLHFRKAAEALDALEKSPPVIESCNDAMALSTKVAEIVSQMEKVSRYAGPCVGIVDVLCSHCHKWTTEEMDLWWEMETTIAEWLRDDSAHEHCRIANTKCYGAKHHRSGTNFLGRGGTWVHITNDPHNPIS
jgi:hypothetical protein